MCSSESSGVIRDGKKGLLLDEIETEIKMVKTCCYWFIRCETTLCRKGKECIPVGGVSTAAVADTGGGISPQRGEGVSLQRGEGSPETDAFENITFPCSR